MRVLVVDDVPTVCGVIADMFQRHGHEAYACVERRFPNNFAVGA